MEKYLLVLFLFFYQLSLAQKNDIQIRGKSISNLKEDITSNALISSYYYQLNFNSKVIQKNISSHLFQVQQYEGLPHTAFFCRMEDRLDKKVKTPIRFRLGNKEYVDQLEGKK